MSRFSFSFRFLSLWGAFAALAGCAVGPDFVPPSKPNVAAYDAAPVPETTADGAQVVVFDADLPASWWELFHSEKLNRLVEQAVRDNPDLASAEAALRVAQDHLSAGGAAFYPEVKGAFSSTRAQTSTYSNGGASSIYNMHTSSVGVSYNVDVWGGTRRSLEELQALADVARFRKEGAYLALTTNVVTLAITEAGLREQIAATQEIIAAQEKSLAVSKVRFDAGAAPKSAVVAQQAALASAKAGLPALQHQLTVARHALTALVGRFPVEGVDAEFRLDDLTLPREVPLSLPGNLVAQRPDIRAAEENLHAASAAIGVAVAARLPNIILSADIGTMAGEIGRLFSPGGGFWDLGATAAGTIFDAGALADKEEAARDAFEGARADYRKTVLTAFQDVADVLHALQSDAESLNAKREAARAASEALILTQAQFSAGAVSVAELLLAQQAAHQARAALAQAQAQRYADTAALFAALGGGWWNRSRVEAKVVLMPPLFEKGSHRPIVEARVGLRPPLFEKGSL